MLLLPGVFYRDPRVYGDSLELRFDMNDPESHTLTWRSSLPLMHRVRSVDVRAPTAVAEVVKNALIEDFCAKSREDYNSAVILQTIYKARLAADGADTGPQVSLLELCQAAPEHPPVLYTRVLDAVSTGDLEIVLKRGQHDAYNVTLKTHAVGDGRPVHSLEYTETYGHAPRSETEDVDAATKRRKHARALYLKNLLKECMGGIPYAFKWEFKKHAWEGNDRWELQVPHVRSKRVDYNFRVTFDSKFKSQAAPCAVNFMAKLQPIFPGHTDMTIQGSMMTNLGKIKADDPKNAEWDPRKSMCMYALKTAFGVQEFDPRDTRNPAYARTGFVALTGHYDDALPNWIHPNLRGGTAKPAPRRRYSRSKSRGSARKTRPSRSRSRRSTESRSRAARKGRLYR